LPFNEYYQEELAYLREMGEVFSRAYPKLAPFLADKGNDPDVERLMEGFAFIAGRIRQKLDDQLPELTHGLHSLLWPNLLRPIPSASILQFMPLPGAVSEKQTITRGVEIDSKPVDGTPCRFKTCYDVDIYPISLTGVGLKRTGPTTQLELQFQLHEGAAIDKIEMDSLRFFLNGDLQTCFTLYSYFFRHLTGITVKGSEKDDTLQLRPDVVRAGGFADDEELVPYPANAFIGYRLLQEYFSLPQKFLFLELAGLRPLSRLPIKNKFSITFEFDRRIDDRVRLSKSSILLYCTPIVNLFSKDADPIRIEHNKDEYRVRPSASEPSHFEIYSIDRVEGWSYGDRKKLSYAPFASFDRGTSVVDEGYNYYRIRLRPSVVGMGVDTFLSFESHGEKGVAPQVVTVSSELTCTNNRLPEKLRIGDISIQTGSSPEFAEFKNVLPVTVSTPPPLESDLHWQLISNMALNYLSLADVQALRVVLSTYNFPAFYDRQAERAHELRMDGLSGITLEPTTMMFKGLPVRGYKIFLGMKSGNFSSEGEMYLFATILNEFFSLYASINSFIQLIVRDIDRGDVYQWTPRIGQQPLL